MNIFVLACCPTAAADLHCDAHVCKMIIETAQLLYTFLHRLGSIPRFLELTKDVVDADGNAIVPYKPTHEHHPCQLWLHGGMSHYMWLVSLGVRLCARYEEIYGKTHKTAVHISALAAYGVCKWMYLPEDCWPAEWLRRLADIGESPDSIASCAAKVCLADPPDNCHFGVACMSDETVPLECDEHGHASTIYSYRSLMGHKQAVDLKRMRYAKTDAIPLALQDWMD